MRLAAYQKILTGVHSTAALYFPYSGILNKTLKARILQWWDSGFKVYALDSGYLAVFGEACLLNSASLPGYPVIKQKGVYSNVDMPSDALAKLINSSTVAENDLLVADKGSLRVIKSALSRPVDLSDWIALSTFKNIDVTALGEPPPEPALATVSERKSSSDVFASQGLAPASGLNRLLSSLGKRKNKAVIAEKDMLHKTSWFTKLKHSVGKVFSSGDQRKQNTAYRYSARQGESFGQKVRGAFGDMMMASRMSQLIQRQHARYMRRLIDMLNHGDPLKAIKHAVPLANMREMLSDRTRSFFGFLRPFSNLNFRDQSSSSSSSVSIGDEYHSYLEQLYRQSFNKLDQQGRYKEAAYVLVELLNEVDEAIEYLEAKGQLPLAAELADAREVDPAVRIRLHFLLGQKERAVELAKLSGHFPEAIALLAEKNPQLCDELKILSAQVLAKAGRYRDAALRIWDIERVEVQKHQWIRSCLAEGGIDGAEMLARWINVKPALMDEILESILALFQNNDCYYDDEKKAFLKQLLTEKKTPNTSLAAKAILRGILCEYSDGSLAYPREAIRQLIRMTDDQALVVDIPRIPEFVANSEKQLPQTDGKPGIASWQYEHQFDLSGTIAITDCVCIFNRQLLIGLGEQGVRCIDESGKTVAEYNVPADRLVVADSGNRVVAIARRHAYCSVSQINMSDKSSCYWDDIPLDNWEPTYNGEIWYVAHDDQLAVVDTQCQPSQLLWQTQVVDQINCLSAIYCNSNEYSVLYQQGRHFQIHRYLLPQLEFHEKLKLKLSQAEYNKIQSVSIASLGRLLVLDKLVTIDGKTTVKLSVYQSEEEVKTNHLEVESGEVERFTCMQDWVALSINSGDKTCVYLLELDGTSQFDCKLKLVFQGACRVHFRLQNKNLICCDDRGRIIVISLDDGSLINEIYV